MRFRPLLVAAAAVLLVAGCSSPHRGAPPATATIGPTSTSAGTTAGAATGSAVGGPVSVPRPAHVVVVVLENHSVDAIVGQSDAPYLAQLASSGAVLTQSYAVTHPSEP
ncbi:MAG: phosphatidylinositol-3-phosphatase, partial [Pseudonocardiales bacterium]|nr:phosphatidylinositol-3-phosphatase [Pseudonocardiales bacterium]